MSERTFAADRRQAFLLFAFVLLGFVVVGRLALVAWLDRPVPTRLPEVGATTDTARPLCFVVLDGLKEASAWAEVNPPMPWLQAFARRGAWGIAWAGDPTLTAPCVRALLTGRAPDLTTSLKNFDADPVAGSFIGYLHDRGGRTAHAGDASIYQFCRSSYDAKDALAIPDQGPTDVGTDDRAVRFLLERIGEGADVVTLHLTRPDHTGHMSGSVGPEYHDACRITDGQTREVVEAFLARHPEGLVLVAADHGVSPTGAHGGGETAARRAPFVLVGPGVARIGPVEISQYALAPTVAGLLGLPIPPLADAPPAPELMDLDAGRELHVMDAYIRARIGVAQNLGGRTLDHIDRKRAEVTARRVVGERGEPYQELAEELNRILNPSSWLHALVAILLSALWLAAAVHLASVETTRRIGGRLAATYCILAILPSFGMVPVFGAATLLLGACLLVFFAAAPGRPRGFLTTIVCLATVPALAALGLSISRVLETPDDVTSTEVGGAIAAAVLLVLLVVASWPRHLLSRLARRAREAPGLVGAFGGIVFGFTLTLSPFVNPFVDIRIVFAAAALGVVVALAVFSRAGRRRPMGERVALLALGCALFLVPRIADIRLDANWLEVIARRDTGWMLAGLLLLLFIPVAVGRRPRREDLLGLVLALAAVAGAYGVCLDEAPASWLSRGTNLVGLAALLVTLWRGTPHGRLLVRLLAAAALARRLTVLDGEFVPFVVFAVGAGLAARFGPPRSRVGLAWLAVGILAVKTAIHHALGGVDSFSTVDVAAGFVGMDVAPAAAAADGGSVTWPIIEATIQLAFRFCLPWVVLLSAAACALGTRARLRRLVGDLSLTFAARGAAIVLALWAFCCHAWWVDQARAVYALGAADVILLLVASLVVGTFARDARGGA